MTQPMPRRALLAILSFPLAFAFLVGTIVWAQSQEETAAPEQPASAPSSAEVLEDREAPAGEPAALVEQPVAEQQPAETPAQAEPASEVPPVEPSPVEGEVALPATPPAPSQPQGPQSFTIDGQVTAVDIGGRRLTIALDQGNRDAKLFGVSVTVSVPEAARLIGPAEARQFSGIAVGANATASGQIENGALVAETVITRLPSSGDTRPEWLRRIRVVPHTPDR